MRHHRPWWIHLVQSLVRFVTAPLAIALHHLAIVDDAIDAVHHKQNRWWRRWAVALKSATSLGLDLLLVPWRLIVKAVWMVWESLTVLGLVRDDLAAEPSRHRRVLWLGVPVLVAIAGLFVAASFFWRRDLPLLAQTYAEAADEAWQMHDYDSAINLYTRLSQLRPETVEDRYRRGYAEEQQGHVAVCKELMAAIAPQNATGYLPAHLWMARHLLAGPQIDPNDAEQARLHLVRVLYGNHADVEANLLMAKLLLQQGQAFDAEPFLKQAVSASPEWRLLLAEIQRMRNDPDASRTEAAVARDYWYCQLQDNPQNVPIRLALAKSYVLLGDYEAALRVLREGLRQHPSAELQSMISQTLVAWAHELNGQNDAQEQRLEMLAEALDRDPSSTPAAVELLTLRNDSSELHGRVDAILERVPPDSTSALTCLALGNAAWAEKDHARARHFFEEAYRKAPDHPAIVNNLAWSLSQVEPRDLERARCLCDDALKAVPNHASLLDTRAHILLRLKWWNEACVDLEVLSLLRPGDAEIEKQLRECRSRLQQNAAVSSQDP